MLVATETFAVKARWFWHARFRRLSETLTFFPIAPLPRFSTTKLAALVCSLCLAASLAMAADPVRLGAVQSSTGAYAAEEKGLTDMLRMLVSEQNAKGGLLGRQIELVVADPGSVASAYVDGAVSLVAKPGQGSHRLVRIAYDQKTGLPLRKSGELQDINDQYDIEDALPDNLRNSVGKCLGSVGDGFDIEGLAAYNGKLYVGLRGPTLRNPASEFGALAYIVETSVLPADAGRSRKEPFMVAVPRGAAIRDMASVRGGILLLLGPDDDNHEVNWSISLWRVDDHIDRKYPVATVDLGVLDLSKALRGDCDETVKPEGMAVLAEGAEGDVERYHLAIFSDGMCDGGPVIVDATRSQ
jgi:hypothetical protein